jgi:hypothetical protein
MIVNDPFSPKDAAGQYLHDETPQVPLLWTAAHVRPPMPWAACKDAAARSAYRLTPIGSYLYAFSGTG